MSELHEFGTIVLVVALGFVGALGTYKLTERFPVPAPALFLLVAAVASDVFPGLETVIWIHNVERIGVVALVVILFDGGMQVGWRRFRGAAFLIASLGVVGTFATAALMAVFAHGSGFLAVFVAGLLIGDERAPYKAEIERFHTSLASIAEIVMFAALGLTIHLTGLRGQGLWSDGLLLALLLVFVARPLVAGALLLPVRLRLGERLFVVWGGLKGAVPILLAALTILAPVEDARQIYGIVFVVVAFSVVVQGASIPFAAARLGVPMRAVEPEPWDISIRLRDEPEGVLRYVV